MRDVSLVLASRKDRDFDTSVIPAIASNLVLRSADTNARYFVSDVANSRHLWRLIDRIEQMADLERSFLRKA